MSSLEKAIEAYKEAWCSAPFFNGEVIANWPIAEIEQWINKLQKARPH